MNAVEIEEAITQLAEQPFDAEAFPFAFLEAFGNKETTIKRLKSETKSCTNASDLKDEGGVLQRNNIHILVSPNGQTANTLTKLKQSPATEKAKAKFVLATDGKYFEAEDVITGETVACNYENFPDHFGFFLPLAGISTVKQIRDSSFDIRATSRLNKLYVELLKNNPDWDTADRRHDMNHFMARLIFCFFAEDTDIFSGQDLFTDTIAKMSESNSSNTHEVIEEIFGAMNTKQEDRKKENIRNWADKFPYVNGGLFSGSTETPKFSKIARSYLLHVGSLDWTQINPDIFGSMIQAVADEDERGELGMHYTSVPNILKVLNPLFLDDLREQLEQAGDNGRRLLNLRKRMSNIRVFDPACGSGNFLVIAYKQMRDIEAEINNRRHEANRPSEIPLTNFRGIELRDFPAEIARLALIIAEYQCDLLYRGQKLALAEFLPLDAENWITSSNALEIDWTSICPPTGRKVSIVSDDLFGLPIDQAEIDFENEGGETYVCGNPPYIGTKHQTKENKAELVKVFSSYKGNFKNIDYIGAWILLAAKYQRLGGCCGFAFVSTTSLFEGEQVEIILNIMRCYELKVSWCVEAFKWANNAAHNAGVSCCVVGFVGKDNAKSRYIFTGETKREVKNIGPYLVEMPDIAIQKKLSPISSLPSMSFGSMSNDDGNFTFSDEEYESIVNQDSGLKDFFKTAIGGAEFIKGINRRILYVPNSEQLTEEQYKILEPTFDRVKRYRSRSKREATRKLSLRPERFAEDRHVNGIRLFVPQIMSEKREYITAGYLNEAALVIAPHMEILGGDLFAFAILCSKLHKIWIATVCGKLETRFRYSNTLGWNTFPVPMLTEKNKKDLDQCSREILLVRESHFPATIADLYDPENMPEDLRRAHDRNDEVLERIYIGRRFKNDTERLEKLFDLYTQMTSEGSSEKASSV